MIWGGDVYLGESYVKEIWSVSGKEKGDSLYQCLFDVVSKFDNTPSVKKTLLSGIKYIFGHVVTNSSILESENAIDMHYNNGVDLFRSFLCKNMVYTSAIWEEATSLRNCANQKVNRILDLARVVEGKNMLEIGCGYGFLSHIAAVERKSTSHGPL